MLILCLRYLKKKKNTPVLDLSKFDNRDVPIKFLLRKVLPRVSTSQTKRGPHKPDAAIGCSYRVLGTFMMVIKCMLLVLDAHVS